MPDSEKNRASIAQFVAQEITRDGKIPHATIEAVEAIAEEARKRAKEVDNTENALTLRLRELGGILRLAGDIAVMKESALIEADFVKAACKQGRTVEEQLKEKYGSMWKVSAGDVGSLERGRENKEVS